MFTTRQQLHISPLRIRRVRDSGPIPSSGSLMQDEEIVTMHVHWMRGESGRIIYHKCDGGVGAVVVNIPVCGIAEISLVGEEKNGCVVVAAESFTVSQNV